jgi:tetratricopeptide (TPR) repeat protein
MKMVRVLLFVCLSLCYVYSTSFQEQRVKDRATRLAHALPSSITKITTGYVRQIFAEILFIRTSVFIGGLKPGTPPNKYSDALGYNLGVIANLYPHFKDTYSLCQSSLSYISKEAAETANNILETGIDIYPNDQTLHLFYASNFFLVMNKPLKAAAAFSQAAEIKDASPIFAHLAALLKAQGGDIKAGILSLQTMAANEKNDFVRTRYEEEISTFYQALEVQYAVNNYVLHHNEPPNNLDLLVPKYIDEIPFPQPSFVLEYKPPNVHIRRP